MTGSALRLEESRDGRWYRPGGEIFINWGGPGGGEARGRISIRRLRMTGSALRLEESRDGRWLAAPVRGKIYRVGEVQEGERLGVQSRFVACGLREAR